jgi:hypothetical protein
MQLFSVHFGFKLIAHNRILTAHHTTCVNTELRSLQQRGAKDKQMKFNITLIFSIHYLKWSFRVLKSRKCSIKKITLRTGVLKLTI